MIEAIRPEFNHTPLGGNRPNLGLAWWQFPDDPGLSSRRETGHAPVVPPLPSTPSPSGGDYASRIASELAALGIDRDYGPQRGLSLQPEATEFVVARVLSDGRELRLTPETAAAWTALRDAAAASGITLLLISGFRSVTHQRDILRRKLDAGTSLQEILSVNAAPGYSEHHTGRAIDVGTPGCPPLSEAFENTTAFVWLRQHAAGFGFRLSYPRGNPHGVIYEPWHWFHLGTGVTEPRG